MRNVNLFLSKSRWLNFFILALALFATFPSIGQVSNYSFSQSTGTYTQISGGTVFSSTVATTFDSEVWGNLPIGFTFNYNGTDYTEFGINANGWISMGSTTPVSSSFALSSGTTNNVISAASRDLFGRQFVTGSTTSGSPTVTMTTGSLLGVSVGDAMSGTGTATGATVSAVSSPTITMSLNGASTGTGRNIRFHNGTIRYETIGTAPNRKLVVQWSKFSRWATSGPSDYMNFQIVLNETSNNVDIIYDFPYVNTSGTHQVGLRGASSADFNNRATTSDWGATTSGGTNAATCSVSNTIFPASGLTFSWTPPSPCSGTPEAGTITLPLNRPTCPGSAPGIITTSGITTGVTGLTYQWEESIDAGGSWANATGGTGATTVTYTPPVYAGTPIQYRLKVTCTPSGLFDVSDVVVNVTNPAVPAIQASSITTSALSNTSATITWTNGSGGRRYVVLNTANIFTDPAGTGDVTVAETLYTSGEQIVYDGTGTSVSVTGLTANTTYFVRVYEYLRCTGSPNTNYYNVTAATNNPGNFTTLAYCVPTYSNGPGTTDQITNVTLGLLNNSSGASASPYYTFFNSVTIPNIERSVNASVSISFGSDVNQFGAVWIDFNQDGIFDVSEGAVSTSNAGSNGTTTIDLAVPLGATLGNTRMRVRGGNDSALSTSQACGASSSSYGETEDYIVNIIPAPSCFPPTALTVGTITATSAALSWTAPSTAPGVGYEWAVTTSAIPPASGTTEATTGASVTSLSSNTIYYLHVRSECTSGTDYSIWETSASFTTLCNAANVPYLADMSNVNCLSVLDQNIDGTTWAQSISAPFGMPTGFVAPVAYYNYDIDNDADDYFFTQGINLISGSTYKLTYKYGNNSTSYTEKMDVRIGLDKTMAAQSTILADHPNITGQVLQNGDLTFTVPTDDVYYISFRAYSDANEFYLILDDIEVKEVAKLNLTTFIEGFMDGSNSAMLPVLLNSGVMGATSTQCDTITVALHNMASPFAEAFSFKGVLNTDGTISCTFPGAAIGNSYYVVVKHRNALDTWSANPVAITATTSYSFASGVSQAYGSNLVAKGSLYAMFSGDIDSILGDDAIDLIDYSIWEADYNNLSTGYIQSDLNGDGSVDLIDYSIWEGNFNNLISVLKP